MHTSKRAAALTVAAITGLTVLSTPGATAAAQMCRGEAATIVGTDRELMGTDGDDVIVTEAAEIIDSGAGNDLVCVTAGSDRPMVTVDAGPGDDLVDTTLTTSQTTTLLHTGRDVLVGGPGTDSVWSLGFDDRHSTGGGKDTVFIQADREHLSAERGQYAGGPGRDLLMVMSGDFDLVVDLGSGTVAVGDAADNPVASFTSFQDSFVSASTAVLRGDAESNRLTITGCRMKVVGRERSDRVRYVYPELYEYGCKPSVTAHGGPGRDVLAGSKGRDVLLGGPGLDRADGRAGSDRCRAEWMRSCER